MGFQGPLLLTWFNFPWISNHIYYKLRDEIIRWGLGISSHTLPGMWLLFHAAIKVNPCFVKGTQILIGYGMPWIIRNKFSRIISVNSLPPIEAMWRHVSESFLFGQLIACVGFRALTWTSRDILSNVETSLKSFCEVLYWFATVEICS